jgi:hypothetical protein
MVMLGYVLDMLPLISQLKTEFLEVHQSWYSDNAAADAAFSRVRATFKWILELGSGYGYHP